MRIAIVIYSLAVGGAERVTAILARHWAGIGHKVKIMTFADEATNFYRLGAGVECESLHCGSLSRTLPEGIISNLTRIRTLRRHIKSFQPDIVIGMMSTTSALVALSCIGLPCKTVGTERSYPPRASLKLLWRIVCAVSYWFLDIFITQTTETREWIRSHTAAKAIHVIPNPLVWPLERHPPYLSPENFCLPGRSIVLAVGRLSSEKNFARLVEAFAHVQADHPTWDLVILGTGPDKELLEECRDQLGLSGRVFFPGRVGNVGDWYERASIFAMTSLFEGFPNALLEAMAYGLAVISVDCDTGPRDLIKNDINGLLIALSDQGALIEGLRRLMDDDRLRASFAEGAREVIKRYAVDDVSRRWIRCFNAAGAGRTTG